MAFDSLILAVLSLLWNNLHYYRKVYYLLNEGKDSQLTLIQATSSQPSVLRLIGYKKGLTCWASPFLCYIASSWSNQLYEGGSG